jgi:DNA invertase Pin-like site-specific DNA recombinase
VATQDKTIAIYVRTSVHSGSTGQSPAVQEQACRSYASVPGWHVGEVFADQGIAGTQRDRPGMGWLLAAAHGGAIKRVLVARPDRLSRSQADIQAILGELEGLGVACVSVQQPCTRPGRPHSR